MDHTWADPLRELPDHLQPEATAFLEGNDLVLAQEPWLVAAALDVQVMRLPSDGWSATRDALQAFHPGYMLLLGGNASVLQGYVTKHTGIRLDLIGAYPTGSWYRIEY